MTSNPTATNRKKVLVGMSGGVDSSLAAALLLKQGYEVAGGFIKNWSDTKDLWTGECEWRGERRDAMRVAAKLGIPLLTFDFEESYRERVLERMFDGYKRGVTPNPDVLCNEEIKFGLFYDAAMKAGFDYVATGHYARIVHEDSVPLPASPVLRGGDPKTLPLPKGGVGGGSRAHLLRGVDQNKDQSYFLYRVKQEALSRALMPIGEFEKSDVRRLAAEFDLPTANKPDSQGICFIGKLDFKEFLRKRIEPAPGNIVDENGTVIGTHDGLDAYTIGQRQGMGVSKDGRAWYVAGKNRGTNELVVVSDREHPFLFKKHLLVEDLHWIAGAPKAGEVVDVVVRYRSKAVPAVIASGAKQSHPSEIATSPSAPRNDKKILLEFREPVWAPAPGQSAVLYRGEECLGGGTIGEDSV